MPPKKGPEAAVTTEIPDQPPSLESDGVMDDLLAKARSSNLDAVQRGVVNSLGLHDSNCNLRHSVTVDFYVETIYFASTNGYGPKKTLNVLAWLNSMRRSIERNHGSDEEARQLFKEFLVRNAEKYLRECAPPQDNEQNAAAEAAAAAAAATAAASTAKKDPKAGKTAPALAAVAAKDDPSTKSPSENPYISVAEAAPLAQFALRGLLQHAQLFAFVATLPRPAQRPRDRCSFTLAPEVPLRLPPLSRALTSTDVEAIHKLEEQRALEELQRLQAEEAAALEAERQAELARQAEIRRIAEEEQANQLYFSKAGAGPAVELVQKELEFDLSQRQRDILARLAKLEHDVTHLGLGSK